MYWFFLHINKYCFITKYINTYTHIMEDFSAAHTTAILVAVITGIVSPIVMHGIAYFFKKKKHLLYKESLNKKGQLANEQSILKKLETIKDKFKCDRVWLAEFHNGTHTYSGKSFQKFSVTYETTNEGIATEALNTQNIPTSVFTSFFKKLIDDHFYYVKNTKTQYNVEKRSADYHIAVALESFWETRGTKSFIALAIKDLNSNFVGFLCLDGVVIWNKQHLIYTQTLVRGYQQHLNTIQ